MLTPTCCIGHAACAVPPSPAASLVVPTNLGTRHGRYVSNFSQAQSNPWGKNKGCSFCMDKCVTGGVRIARHCCAAAPLCDSSHTFCAGQPMVSMSLSCSGRHTAWHLLKSGQVSVDTSSFCTEPNKASCLGRVKGYCGLSNQTAALPTQFQ